jgi:hypothetical protein
MAFQFVRSLALIFLLAVDWAGDPHHGLSLFSRPMSSQEVVPTWTVQRHEIRIRLSTFHAAAPLLDETSSVLPCFLLRTGPLDTEAASLFGPNSLYVLMSLQR